MKGQHIDDQETPPEGITPIMVVDAVVDIAFCNYEAIRVVTQDNEIRHAFLIYRSDKVVGEYNDLNANASASYAAKKTFAGNQSNAAGEEEGNKGGANPIGPINSVLVFFIET